MSKNFIPLTSLKEGQNTLYTSLRKLYQINKTRFEEFIIHKRRKQKGHSTFTLSLFSEVICRP